MASGDHWPSSAASSSRPRPVIVHLTENYWLLMLLFGTSGIPGGTSVFTFYKPLTFALNKVSDAWSARQQRQLSAISEYTMDIRHVAGKDNVVADALSRAAISAISGGIDFSALAAAQLADPVDMAACQTAITGLQLKDIPFGPNNTTLLCDVSLGRPCPLVPVSFHRHIFDTLHGLSHPGVGATCTLVARKYVWHGLGQQV